MVEIDRLFSTFKDTAVQCGFADEWDAYQNDDKWPEKLVKAHADYTAALHADYDRRGITGLLETSIG